MIHVITETKYSHDDSFESFAALVEGDGDPRAIIDAWANEYHNAKQAIRRSKALPMLGWPSPDAGEEA